MRRFAHPSLLGLLCLLGCEPAAPDHLVIRVVDGTGGRLSVPGDLDAFEVRVASVYGGAAAQSEVTRLRRTVVLARSDGADGPRAARLPQTLSVVRHEEGSGTVRVEVLGLRAGRVLQRIERTSGFGPGRVELPPFALTPACFDVICPPGLTCEVDGVCRDATRGCPGGVPCDAGALDAGPCGPAAVACGDVCVPFDEANCGACGRACAPEERCVANECRCAEGLFPCEDRCVDLASDREHCGTCGNLCFATGGPPLCVAGRCTLECPDGRGDCDGDPTNGCETNVTSSEAHCGDCDTSCLVPEADSRCEAGACTPLDCAPGRADCNRVFEDGCEVRLDSDPDHCGDCGATCAFANALPSCRFGRCRIQRCDSGFGDCDGDDANGCEASVSCAVGAPCATACGTTGTMDCTDPCAPVCSVEEQCNATDDDCDGRCDELSGCRRSVFRSQRLGIHCYGTDDPDTQCPSTPVTSDPYFFVYSETAPRLVPFYRCTDGAGRTKLTVSATCEGDGTVDFSVGWVATADTCGAVPLYRLRHPTTGDHFYTIDAGERDDAAGSGFVVVGVEAYVWPSVAG